MSMHLDAVLNELAAARAALGAAVDRVPPELRTKKPGPDRWSVNEVLEHLALVEASFTRRIADGIAEARANGVDAELEGEPERLSDPVQATIRDRSTQRKSPNGVIPSGRLDTAAALQAIDAVHDKLAAALYNGRDVALTEVRLEHRAFGELTAYQWVEFLAGHEARHMAQIEEIAASLAGSS